jgi:hypothetical protein
MTTLHLHKYSAGGGFERLPALPRLREARRWSYSNRYWMRAMGTWLRLLILLMVARFVNVFANLVSQPVSYSFMNSEYWPISENIDFVLTIPHWYLRPLMGALVSIPHHYLGFIYIGLFFIFVFFVPWTYENTTDSIWTPSDNADVEDHVTTRWDWLHNVIAANFFISAAFTTSIIPTGKFFIASGSMDGLIYAYWVILIYIAGMAQLSYFIRRKKVAILNQ